MKKRGRPPRNCATEEARHENGDIGKIEPEASREDSQTSETPSWDSFKRDTMESLDSQFVPYEIASSGASKPMLAESDITDEMVRMVTLAIGGIAPNAWGLTDPKRIIAAVCNAAGSNADMQVRLWRQNLNDLLRWADSMTAEEIADYVRGMLAGGGHE